MINVQDLLARIDHGDSVARLVGEIRGSPDPASVLEAIAASRRSVHRAWATIEARAVLGPEAASFLESMLRDRDRVVRETAVTELVKADPDRARLHLDATHRLLTSTDFSEPVLGMTIAMELRDQSAVPLLQTIIDAPAYPFHRLAASVALEFLRGDMGAIFDAIRKHDHARMRWLTQAARLMGGAAARLELEAAVAAAPDKDCRHWASLALAGGPPDGAPPGGTG